MVTGFAVLRGSFKTTSIQIKGATSVALMVGALLASCSGDDSNDKSHDSAGSTARGGQGGGTQQKPLETAGSAGTDPVATGGTEPVDTGGAAGSDGSEGHSGGGVDAVAEGGADGISGGGTGGTGGTSGTGGGVATDYLCEPACAAGMMCCPSGIHTECVPTDADGCNVPDLTINDVAVQSSLDIDFVSTAADPCLLEEACVGGPGMRRVLVFDTETPNIGTGDVVAGVPSMSNPDFQYSSCHNHYHFQGYASYDLVDGAGNVVAAGHKQAYCLRDNERVMFDADVRSQPFYDCGGGVQGISRGWSDVYYVGLPCQWVDITGVPAGSYFLRIRLNPERRIYELDYDNNELLVAVTIPQ